MDQCHSTCFRINIINLKFREISSLVIYYNALTARDWMHLSLVLKMQRESKTLSLQVARVKATPRRSIFIFCTSSVKGSNAHSPWNSIVFAAAPETHTMVSRQWYLLQAEWVRLQAMLKLPQFQRETPAYIHSEPYCAWENATQRKDSIVDRPNAKALMLTADQLYRTSNSEAIVW